MRRFCRSLKEVRAVASRVKRGRIKEQPEIVPVCSVCNKESSDYISDEKGERVIVKGIAIGNPIYCKYDAFAKLRVAYPGMTDAELEARLKPYDCDDCVGISQLYYYDASNGLPAAT